MLLLNQLVQVFHILEVWCIDPLLHGELTLKLSCLKEAKAELGHSRRMSRIDTLEVSQFLLHDRSQLLQCLSELLLGLKCVQCAREDEYIDKSGAGEVSDLEMLHVEFVHAITRVKLKLASTIPPPRT